MLYELRQQKGSGTVLSRVLANRDISSDLIRTLTVKPEDLIEDPMRIAGFKEVTHRIEELIKDPKRRVHVFADYDPDGLTSGYIMSTFLYQFLPFTTVRFPERYEGYGVSIQWIKENVDPGETVITVDNGITMHDTVSYCKEHGIEIIVTDHHRVDEAKGIPDCLCCDPYLDSKGSGHHLCGAGIAWKIADYLSHKIGKGYLPEGITYAAIGTVSDMMDPVPENLAIVKMGLDYLNGSKDTYIKNIKNLGKALRTGDKISAGDIAWKIGPALNSTGRLGNFSQAVEMIYSDNIAKVANVIDANERRKVLTRELVAKAIPTDDNVYFYEVDPSMAGISGLVANKIMETLNRPVFVFYKKAAGLYGGSARVPSYLDIWNDLQELKQRGFFSKVAGHSHAFGIEFPSSLTNKVWEQVNACTEGKLRDKDPEVIDTMITLEEVNKDTYAELCKIPFWRGDWSIPKFLVHDVEIVKYKQSSGNPENIKLTIMSNDKYYDLWFWGGYNKYLSLGQPVRINMIGTIGIGMDEQVTFSIEDIEPCNS